MNDSICWVWRWSAIFLSLPRQQWTTIFDHYLKFVADSILFLHFNAFLFISSVVSDGCLLKLSVWTSSLKRWNTICLTLKSDQLLMSRISLRNIFATILNWQYYFDQLFCHAINVMRLRSLRDCTWNLFASFMLALKWGGVAVDRVFRRWSSRV